ncbi:MAG: hypothetical protein IJK89_08240 [Clostridia bacterium]|nr:hypothetical protein [Clostridia bacterium]
MLYKKNTAPELSDELFKNPTCEYRGTPFWAWNNLLTKEELERQIDVFKEMGLGGFHMHVRTGLKNQYLSDEYMALVKDCVNKAKANEMLAHLYDEDRWPSGAAGGLVTKDERYRARCLLFTPFKDAENYHSNDSRSEGGRSGRGRVMACYDVALDDKGFLTSYRRIAEDEEAKGTKWYALLEVHTPSSWYNGQTYADTLSKEAIEKFIEVTHERYAQTVGDEFDETVPSIFTDEPQFTRKKVLNNSFDEMDILMPWTDKVPELYKEYTGEDIFATLPELFWDLPGSAPSRPRYRYHDFIAELFARSFADTIGAWCREHKIALTGHMMEEPTLHSQCAALGEAMRSYRGFDIPGIDLLCNNHEFTTAKQAQSAVHQFGYEGMLSELYGVTGWDCDFRTYKHQGDWQAALGVTVRVPHLSWYAMGGEAKRDYPASIHYQSPWYKKYRLVEDHFARVNAAMTRGKPVVKVGVIHPIESFWLHWGPNDKSALLRESLDERFHDLTEWLLRGSVDFNFISEALLPSLCENGSAPLQVGKMAYDAIVVPGCETLRATTLERLEAFRRAGGRLIFMGDAPYLCDAAPSDRGRKLYDESERIDFSRASLLTALEDCRTVTLRFANGRLTDDLIYQIRQDGDDRWLFIAHAYEPRNKDVDGAEDIRISLDGDWAATLYDTGTGEIAPLAAEYANGKTVVSYRLERYDSLLLKLTPGRAEAAARKTEALPEGTYAPSAVDYSLTEPNVLVLDMAEYKLSGDAAFAPKEEMLRLDNVCREKLGIPKRGGAIVQPWVKGAVPDIDELTLRFTFDSEIEYTGAFLALEMADKAKIAFNGAAVDNVSAGKYVDISIDKVALPPIVKGQNTLTVTYPFGESSDIENMFILGDFGVKLTGNEATLTALPEKLGFGDLTGQGFPFYGGAVTYRFKAEAKDGRLTVRANWYRGAVISVSVDGVERGDIVYPPYTLTVEGLEDGKHDIALTLYIHRYNTFGPIHLLDEKASWHGPGAWRSTGAGWTYEYVLRRTGILSAPAIIG